MSEAASAPEHTSSIETIDDVTRRAIVSIPVELVTKEFNSEIDRVQRTSRLKGFRAGKAPRHLIEKMHGNRVQLEVANRLISSTLQEIIRGMEETVIGSPEIELSSFEPGKEITYTANMSVFPRPEVGGYDSFGVTVPKREVSDDDVAKVIDNLLSSKATQKPIEGRTAAQAGDVIDSILKVVENGEESEHAEPLVIAIGEDLLPPELDTGLIGLEVGQTRDITITPTPEQAEKGLKETTYRVHLNGLQQKVLPELTDDFVKELNFEGVQTALELKVDVRKRLEEEQAQHAEDDINSEIMKVLLEGNSFQVPAVLIEDEIRGLAVRAGLVDPKSVNPDTFDIAPFREQFNEAAERRVRMTIIVDRIAEKEDLKAQDADIEAYIISVADKHQLPLEEVKKYFLDKNRAMGTFLEVTRNKVLKFLRERASISFSADNSAPAEDEKKGKSKKKKSAS